MKIVSYLAMMRRGLVALSDGAKSPETDSSLSATKPNHPARTRRSQRRSQITRNGLVALSDEAKIHIRGFYK
jgi:hypothetical protein